MLRMRARGIQDISLLRALERAPRALFMPQRYSDIALRDLVLPIGCGQTAPPPSIVAATIQALGVSRSHSVLEIGAGTGYATALLAQLGREVLSLERCQSLAREASVRLEAFGVTNAQVVWADALAAEAGLGTFDRILVHALIDASPQDMVSLLNPGGALVAIVTDDADNEQRIVRIAPDAAGGAGLSEHGPARAYRPLVAGLTRGI